MEKILKLYTYVDGGINDTPFPNSDNPIEIGAFRYDAKRMGGAPTITASVDYPSCLDGVWTDKVYAKFNGEKYYLKQIPTSSYDNADIMYRHEVTLVSERAVLDNVYFFDVVTGNPSESDKPVSNSTKVTFFGGIRDFASRLNASLEYSGLDYEVVVDNEITTEEKLMSFEDQFFSNVLQAIYNTYEVPYYFDGKTIHIGYAKSDVVVPDLSYGVDNALLSITKNNANYKTVNRATGYGSSDNLTFYYPNNSPKGVIRADVNTTSDDFAVDIVDRVLYSDNVDADGVIKRISSNYAIQSIQTKAPLSNKNFSSNEPIELDIDYKNAPYRFEVEISGQSSDKGEVYLEWFLDDFVSYETNSNEAYSQQRTEIVIYAESQVRSMVNGNYYFTGYGSYEAKATITNSVNNAYIKLPFNVDGNAEQKLKLKIAVRPFLTNGRFACTMRIREVDSEGWVIGDKKIDLKDVGLRGYGLAHIGDTITQRIDKYVNTSKNLMPSIYRQSDAKERFYNAVNYPFLAEDGYELKYGEYLKKEDVEGNTIEVDYVHNDAYKDDEGNYIRFDYPYVEGKAKEHIVAVEDLMPTIKEAVNSMGLRMDMFSEFAYDDDDSDETEENEDGSDRDFVHSYFFGKLRKLDFNLFECAIEQQPMTISFTSGDCGACNFEIGVTEEFPQRNPVMVNPDGTLMRDANGRVVCGQFAPVYENDLQPEQQDTSKYEVWIALKKEEDTYGELMPKAPVDGVGGHIPKACDEDQNNGDTFVILGINLPEEYVTRQERQLEKEIIKYIKDNNEEKFTFSIGFSRIYFAENETILENLSENSKVRIFYNNLPYDLYVSSFSYNLNAGDVLPDIKIELDETLKISQNPIQKAISQVKSQLGNALRNIDVVGAGTPYFLRKDVDDEVIGRVNFRKGVKFGEGGKVEVLDNNSAKLTIEYLEVTKKASFTSLEIQEKTHVGGQILVTPAAINCGEVEEFEDFYRCYFQTKGVEGDEIFNQFAMDDQAICQTYNTWGSRYYWRKVVGVGEDYIDLSKVAGEYDEDSDIPMAGDKIIQLGNQTDATRQNAIVISAHSEDAPCIIQYKNINTFSISDENIVTKLSPYGNLITGVLRIEKGTTGVENLEGLPEFIHENVGEVETGESGSNLLRNSGFTGDYLSEELADEDVLVAESQMFSSPLDYWTANEVSVEANEESESGFGVVFASQGSLAQTLHYNLIANEGYVLSFRARSATGAAIVYTIGDQTGEVVLTNESARYVVKVVVTSSSKAFSLTCDDCSLWEVQLERGTMASSWGRSFLDNSSDRVYWQAQKYISGAIEDASTTFAGGLGLTNMMMFGNYDKETKSMAEVTAGVSGNYEDDHDVAFWAGGDYNSAVKAATDYLVNHDKGTWQPTDAEIAAMAKLVLTHGGTAILNDAIVRGNIYADNGRFRGVVEALSGVFNNVDVQSGKIAEFDINGNSLGIKEEVGGNGMSLYNKYISFYENNTQENTELLARIGAYEGLDTYQHVAEFENKSTNILDSMGGTGFGVCSDVSGYTNSYAFASKKGVFAGFRPHVAILGSSNDSPLQLGKYHHTILAWYGGTIVLDGTPENGQEYEIICPNTSVEEGRVHIIKNDDTENIYLMHDGIKRSGFSVHELGGTRQVVKLVYFDKDKTWFCWHHTY